MKTLLSFFLLASLTISASQAQDSPITGPPPCRFLFYVESSKGMARLSSGAAATVANLVASGVSGLMRPGDSFAVWHFNQEPFQFEFPNRVWHPDKAPALAAEVQTFLRQLGFDHPVRSDLAQREMFMAMTATDPLTVLLISNGESPMVGTPFDVGINKVYLQRGEELRKARLPFVTTLRCVNRQLVNWSVTAGSEEIVLPESAPKVAPAAGVAILPGAPLARVPAPVVTVRPPAPVVRPSIPAAVVPASPVPSTTPVIVTRDRIADVFATPFSRPTASSATVPMAVPAASPRADNAESAGRIIAPPTSDAPPVALLVPPELPARADGPVTVVKILPRSTNAASGVATPSLPEPPRAGESPLTTLRILPARTNAEVVALPLPQLPPLPELPSLPSLANPAPSNPPSGFVVPAPAGATTGATAKPTALFPRKSAPSFALDGPGARSSAGVQTSGKPQPANPDAASAASQPLPLPTPPPLVPALAPVSKVAAPGPAMMPRNPDKPLVPERTPESSNPIAGATNGGGKMLATVPPLIHQDAPTRPIHFLLAGLVLLAVAGWFIVLLVRGGRPRARSSISRAIDQ